MEKNLPIRSYQKKKKMGNFKILHVKPMFTGIITTAHKYVGDQETKSGLLVRVDRLAGTMNPIQQVYAVGTTVQGVKEGDVVKLNFKRYAVAKHLPGKIEDSVQSDNVSVHYELPYVEIDGVQYLNLQNSDIEYIIDKYEPSDGGLFE